MISGNEIESDVSAILSPEEIRALSSYCEGEKNLMISVFDKRNKEFLYHNDSFKTILGYSKQEMTRGGWDFWFQKIKPDELSGIRPVFESIIQNPDFFNGRNAVPSFSYHIQDTCREWFLIQHQVSLLIKSCNELLISYLYDVSYKERIENIFSRFRFSVQNRTWAISNREMEVLQLIGEGYSSRQIADRLYISIHTAISHRKHLIEKFAVKNTAQLIKEASKSYLI
ncbi:LuxR C-terminal-related transcriptional regulator [Cyclobacterium jeungdonense]|uniref:LuxR C-terminal-related transcriptional regulator n=1 Tax=Cyclobacterium jeungdonense TaxID=708087 RepID=A0ABT8CDU1_9BACT|nr:LuxR C-terminal-related transcriptional regulator [Cyclobacterium jeungdonense]MDN3690134.1 LuxR C-terminal-related transcriptional regulator [Cyclobacterium jeungdonense]